MSNGTALFLDTSIQIARIVHSPEIKLLIKNRLKKYNIIATSLIVKQEFKRRLLKEANYLLKQFHLRKSYEQVIRHVQEVLPPQQQRKKNICLQTLMTIDEQDTDEDRSDRAVLSLKYLVKNGLKRFEKSVDHIFIDSNCACSIQPVTTDKNESFHFGTDKCKNLKKKCGISRFLKDNIKLLHKIGKELKKIDNSKKTKEIEIIEKFIKIYFDNKDTIEEYNPCLIAGDLLIALESKSIPAFYTMNGKESQFFCRYLNQDLIVRKPNPKKDDIICMKIDNEWPEF